MAEIVFSTGLVKYNINGSAEVMFNPTDAAFVEKLYNTFSKLDSLQDEYRKEIDGITDNKQIFDIARKRDSEMRVMIDSIFDGANISESVFGGINVYALADGLPLWANLLLSIMDEVDETLAKEQKLTNPRISKYTAKYQKK